jgi:hypothetical protein
MTYSSNRIASVRSDLLYRPLAATISFFGLYRLRLVKAVAYYVMSRSLATSWGWVRGVVGLFRTGCWARGAVDPAVEGAAAG